MTSTICNSENHTMIQNKPSPSSRSFLSIEDILHQRNNNNSISPNTINNNNNNKNSNSKLNPLLNINNNDNNKQITNLRKGFNSKESDLINGER